MGFRKSHLFGRGPLNISLIAPPKKICLLFGISCSEKNMQGSASQRDVTKIATSTFSKLSKRG